jgi:outer membrane protein assembly factor BamD (BamD/ComL family)
MIPAHQFASTRLAAFSWRVPVFGIVAGFFLLGIGGCHVPPAPPHAAQRGASNGAEDDGWLWRQLNGEKKPKTTQQLPARPASQQPAAVQQNPQYAAQPNPQPAGQPYQQPATPMQNPQATPQRTAATYPVKQAIGNTGANSSGNVIVPTVAVEQLDPTDANDIPFSKIGPAQAIVTPPPVLPADPPPSIVSSNSAASALEKKGFEWGDLSPDKIWPSIKKATGYGPNEQIARTAFGDGKKLYLDKKYTEAAAQFRTAADRWPDTPLEEDALFLQAESFFFADEYVKAHDSYEKLFKKYSNSRHLETAVAREFAIGRWWEQMQDVKPLWTIQPNFTDKGRPWFDTYGYAMKAYNNVRMYDPTGPLADQSVMALATSHFRQNNFEEAALEFDQLRKDYPNSDHQVLAHVLGVQSKMRVYQGDLYDKTALKEAHEIADSALTQFGPKLGSEQQRMLQTRANIIEKEAARLYAIGQYYEKNQYNRSARIYYQMVLDEYPRTEKAELAKQHIAGLEGKPDDPPDHIKWLTDLLPESKKR